MSKRNLLLVLFFITTISFNAFSQLQYRAGLNLNNAIRGKGLEASGQVLKKGKVIYNLNLGYTYKTPLNGFQTKTQKNLDSVSADIETSGFFIKPGLQVNLFETFNKFTKADWFVGAGYTFSTYNRKTSLTDLKTPFADRKEQKGTFSGSVGAPYVSTGCNIRVLYNAYLDLGIQYNITKAQTKDNILPARYDFIPGMGGNYKNGNKLALIATARYFFEPK
jgi:hypothetical protein